MDDTIAADDKDWTWVLQRVCPECGADVRSFPINEIGAMVRANSAEWVAILGLPVEALRRRTRPDRWSPLEYACHVRDVYELYDQRLSLMLTEDGPSYPNWDQDVTAVEQDYARADPAAVARDLRDRAHELASRFELVSGDDWERTGHRSDGATFTIETFARYLIHDPIHHLWDVRSQLPTTVGPT
ncbi:MAG: DinB family protein [Microthrixaceae bacterium]